MICMLRGNWSEIAATHVERLMQLFSKKIHHWSDTLDWLKQLLHERDASSANPGSGLDFDRALQVSTEVGNRFATFNTAECGRLKSGLVTKESAKPGRVRLVDFYRMGLE